LHRIYQGIVKELSEDAGLTLVRASQLHSNENDPLDIGVQDPSIRENTDKFVLLYQK
jgi:predicted methyltransferase